MIFANSFMVPATEGSRFGILLSIVERVTGS